MDLIGGTSASAPVFAGMVALLNGYLGTYGLGNINPSLYWMAQTTSHRLSRHHHRREYRSLRRPEVRIAVPTTHFGYTAGPGWDAASGLGSVDATQMFIRLEYRRGHASNRIRGEWRQPYQYGTFTRPDLHHLRRGSRAGERPDVWNWMKTGTCPATWPESRSSVNGTDAPLLYVGSRPNQRRCTV